MRHLLVRWVTRTNHAPGGCSGLVAPQRFSPTFASNRGKCGQGTEPPTSTWRDVADGRCAAPMGARPRSCSRKTWRWRQNDSECGGRHALRRRRRRRWSLASPGTTASCRPHATNTAADSAAGAAATADASAACITAKWPRRRAVQRSGNAQLRRHVPAGSDGPGTVGERLCCGFCRASRARAADGFARSGVLALGCIDWR